MSAAEPATVEPERDAVATPSAGRRTWLLFALAFAVHRMDHDAPVIHAAALLHDFAELLLWLHAPVLSLIVVNRDYGRFLGQTIDSIKAQDYAPIECVIVDNGSTDQSLEVIERHAVLRDHVGQRSTVAVLQPAQDVDVERADDGARAEEAAAEAGTLLVGPVDQRERALRRRGRGGQRAQHLEPAHHAQRAVEPAAGRDGVEVRTDDHRVGALAAQVGPQVAGLVLLDLHRQGGQLLAQHRPRLGPLGRPAQAARAGRAAGAVGERDHVLTRAAEAGMSPSLGKGRARTTFPAGWSVVYNEVGTMPAPPFGAECGGGSVPASWRRDFTGRRSARRQK